MKLIRPFFFIGLSLSLIYILLFIYYEHKYGLFIIRWHSHLMIYPIAWYIGYYLIKLFNLSKKYSSTKYLIRFSQILLILFCTELFFVLTGLNKTYLEKVNGNYTSYYETVNSYYHSWPTNQRRCLKRPESNYCYKSNSLGYIDTEWEIKKKTKEIRVLALGDSFTEGDGAPFDSSYVAILRNILKNQSDNYYVMNAGVCGSDPFNNFVNFRDRLLKYKPDIVLQTLSSYDLTADIAIRGGFERYQEDGTVKHLNAPWWEPIYAISYLSRNLFHALGYNHLFLKEGLTKNQKRKFDNYIIKLIIEYEKLCKKNNIQLVLILRPEKNEIFDKKYMYNFSEISNYIKSRHKLKYVDLLPKYLSYIKENDTNLDNYFWKKDGHHCSLGYKMMAETIFEECFVEDMNK